MKIDILKTNKTNTLKGFTLIELLVVVAIIGVLASIVMTSLNAARTKARDTSRITSVKQIQKALELYFSDYGSYPTNLFSDDINNLASSLVPDYIPSIDYNMTNISAIPTYFSPSYQTDSYLIYVSLEKQTQVSPSYYGCRTGVGVVVGYAYPGSPLCESIKI